MLYLPIYIGGRHIVFAAMFCVETSETLKLPFWMIIEIEIDEEI